MFQIIESRCFQLIFYLFKIIFSFYEAIRWFVFQKFGRISRLAYRLEQLNQSEQELCNQLVKLNEEYLSKSSHIQQRRNSIALERVKVLDQLANSSRFSSVTTLTTIKLDPVINNENIPTISDHKPKTEEVTINKNGNTSNRMTAMKNKENKEKQTRAMGLNTESKVHMFQKEKKNSQMQIKSKSKEEKPSVISNKNNEQTSNSNFNKLIGFNLAANCINEYIDLIVESAINEFRNVDNQLEVKNIQNQQFRETIVELYGDPEWRPFINDLKKQYKIFCYL